MTRAFRLTRPEPKEADVLASVLRALKVHPAVAWSARMNAAAGKLMRLNGNSQFIRFGFPGMTDIMGQLRDGRFLAIEVKRPSGVVSADQKAFIDMASKNGAVAFVARSVDDVFAVLEEKANEESNFKKNTF